MHAGPRLGRRFWAQPFRDAAQDEKRALIAYQVHQNQRYAGHDAWQPVQAGTSVLWRQVKTSRANA